MVHGSKTLTGTTQAIGSRGVIVPWIVFQSKIGNAGKISIGGASVAVDEGLTLASAGNSLILPYSPDGYDLGTIYAVAATPDDVLRFITG